MSPSRFHRIRIHIRFLKHACPDLKVHPFDIQELWEMKEELAKLGVNDLADNNLNFHEVATAIDELEMLLKASLPKEMC